MIQLDATNVLKHFSLSSQRRKKEYFEASSELWPLIYVTSASSKFNVNIFITLQIHVNVNSGDKTSYSFYISNCKIN